MHMVVMVPYMRLHVYIAYFQRVCVSVGVAALLRKGWQIVVVACGVLHC